MSQPDREAALKTVRDWLKDRDWVGMVKTPIHPHELCCEVVDDLATFLTEQCREAKIEALAWAVDGKENHV